MENFVTDDCIPAVAEPDDSVKCTESAENFQKFIYQLFEKNGILSDLRAYLRGHIIDVLKSAQTGDPPACQKHFTQRLDLTYQAINILIAEYLMRLEFSYSLSVFVSEIPLANMVFGFAKALLQGCPDNSQTRFNNNDIWSILNYLGIQCDCEHASNVVEMYKADEVPLLLCILKCMPMYKEPASSHQLNSSEESVSSAKSSDTLENGDSKCARNFSYHDKCKHYAFCKTCQNRIERLKDKYKKKKKCLTKNIKSSKINPCNMENLMKNISIMERSLIDEMFEQLKTVYEAEVEMLRAEEEKRVRHSLTSHALQLQKRKDEMEESFRARESELERNIQQKKRFLWGLARSLREQHSRLATAMQELQAESTRLSDKEESLKAQLAAAEEILRKRGDDMRSQISNELTILETHLESMKKERENINRERIELEHLKSTCDNSKVSSIESHDLHSHYDLLKNELGILRKYLESSKLAPKCVIERSTVTELSDVTSKLSLVLNNDQDCGKNGRSEDSEERLKNQLVNDLKKKKNVNFSQSNLDEIYRERSGERSRERSRSSSSEAGDAADARADVINLLRDENERLKAFARQQREHIDELSSQQARLQAELTATRFRAVTDMASPTFRPRTAPTVMPAGYFVPSVNPSASANILSSGWRKGAGEELSMFSNAQPRILVPGDTLPFIGVLRDRHGDTRRHLINQWRAVRRRVSPVCGVSKRAPSRDRNIPAVIRPGSAAADFNSPQTSHDQEPQSSRTEDNNTTYHNARETLQQRPKTAVGLDINKNREKSPKSVLREAKQKLRTKDTMEASKPIARDKSPTAVLKEAKLRLRKLEIEAEAVEKSYLDFRKRHSELRDESYVNLASDEVVSKDILRNLDVKRSRSLQKLDDAYKIEIETQYKDVENSLKKDFDKYLREYRTKLDVNDARFRIRTTIASTAKPIPKEYAQSSKERRQTDYLETPLTEFRKFYQSERQFRTENSQKSDKISDKMSEYSTSSNLTQSSSRKDAKRKAKHNKDAELERLKHNISTIYNLPNKIVDTIQEETKDVPKVEDNLLRVEIENVKEVKKAESNDQDVLVFVESSANAITNIYNLPKKGVDIVQEKTKEPPEVEDNLLRVEIENVNEVKNAESNDQDVLVFVESSANASEKNIDTNQMQMTIIVSPKRSPKTDIDESLKSPDRSKIYVSPTTSLNKNNVLDIFNADANELSSVQMELELSKVEELEKGEDYPDNFSADVDNYNSHSDLDNTPISLPKTSEDENFWDDS